MVEIMDRLMVKSFLLALCLVLMPFSGFAAGLGKLSVSSSLGEPFKAQIEVLSVSADEIDSLVATMASEETYIAQGIARLDIHSNIEVELAQNPDGTPVLKLHSSQPVSDSFLDMLIQLDWASGRLLREYTILLDPPDLKAATDDASALPNALPSVELSVQPVASSREPLPVETATFMTKPGDNLNEIAKQLQVDGVSIDQMLVGLFDNNKQAFIQGNMNRLKVGKIIKVPSHDNLVAIDEPQAKQLVQVHTANWKAYRGSLASTVALAPNALEVDQKQNATGRITGTAEQAVTSKAGTQNIVKLSAGVKEAVNPSKEMEAKLTMLQEENTAQAKSLKEAQERTANLEKQIADMRQLLALNSQVMAELQKNTAANIVKPAVQLNTSLPPSDGAQVASTSTSPETGVVMTPIPAKHAVLARVLMEIMFGIVDLSVFIATFGAALLLGILWFIRNKRKKALEKFEVNALNLDGMHNKAIFGNTTHRNNAADTEFLKDFAQSAGGSFMDTPDVDPIAEAEVDMAYGRYEQAEATLKNAISKSPKHYELHLKLLELYRAHKDMVAFESFAHTLFAELGADSPIWAKVVEIGSAIDPTNALYQAVTISTKKSKASSVKVSEEAPITSQQVGDQSKDVVMAHVGQSVGHPDGADISNAMEAISLDFELDSAKKSSTKPAPTLSEVLQDQGIQRNANGFDFSSISFDLDEADTKPAVAKPIMDIATAVSASDDLQALDLKLDLVSAYINMGDTEGARVLLDEVKNIGNKQQKLRAKKLLAKLV